MHLKKVFLNFGEGYFESVHQFVVSSYLTTLNVRITDLQYSFKFYVLQ